MALYSVKVALKVRADGSDETAYTAVKEGFGHHAKATDKYLALSAHYAFRPVFCNPAQGHEKGLVESARYLSVALA